MFKGIILQRDNVQPYTAACIKAVEARFSTTLLTAWTWHLGIIISSSRKTGLLLCTSKEAMDRVNNPLDILVVLFFGEGLQNLMQQYDK